MLSYKEKEVYFRDSHTMSSRRKNIKRALWLSVAALFLIGIIFGSKIYLMIFKANVKTFSHQTPYVYIPTGSMLEDVVAILEDNDLLLDRESFLFTARQLKYDQNIKPGRYLLKNGMTNKDLVGLLRSGRQKPLNVVFNNIRTKDQFAERIGEQIEASSSSILNLMNDPDYLVEFGFNQENILCMFLPNTYEMYWNTSADQFMKKMHKEYLKFWNQNRKAKAASLDYSPIEVSILASIVQQESNQETEKPMIAGVYINRLKKNWKLEADPTLVYALGNFTIRRVLSIHKEIDSPYNTYKYGGLPPGPICLQTNSSIDAVLNYSKHSYMYFCAKEDFSGYHNFASSYIQHLINARKFQRALNKRGIRS